MESDRKGVVEANYHEPGTIIRGTDCFYIVGKAGNWIKFAEQRKGKWKVLKFNQAMLDKALEMVKQNEEFRKRMDIERPMAKAIAEMPGDTIHQEDFIKLSDEERVKEFGLAPLTEDEKEQMRNSLPLTLSKAEVQRSMYELYAADEAAKAEAAKKAAAKTPDLEIISIEDDEPQEVASA